MFKTIVVPIDGSELSARAIAYARQIAARNTARVILVRAHLPLEGALPHRVEYTGESEAELAQRERGQSEAELHALAQQLQHDGFAVEDRFVEGRAVEVIINTAREALADLIVMSTHGRGGLGRLVFGSVAQQVLRQAPIPVLMIPARCARAYAPVLKRILVPLDGSTLAAEILGPVADLGAGESTAEVVLLSVIEPATGVYPDALVQVAADPAEQRLEAGRYLSSKAEDLHASVPVAVTYRLAQGDAPPMIAAVAKDEHMDVIAMATHGRSGLEQLVLGSVAMGTLERADVPVLLYRPVSLQPTVLERATAAAVFA